MEFSTPGARSRGHAPPDPTSHAPRAGLRGGTFAPFIPASVGDRQLRLAPEANAATEEAARALAELGSVAPRLTSVEALARVTRRSEALASSRFAGVRISHERLARAVQPARTGAGDARATEVHGNLLALEQAIDIGARSPAFTVSDIEAIHRALLGFTEDRDTAGVLRHGSEDWLDVDDYNPVGADFVPPPAEQLRSSLEDLCAFVRRGDLPAVAQAAVAHAQFKNIHPFAAGNGRTGRALLFTVLRRRGATRTLVPPLSAVLVGRPKAYAAGVGAYSVGRVDAWCEEFARSTALAARAAIRLAEDVETYAADALERLGSPRSDSAARQLLRELPGHPVLDLGTAERLTGKSHTAAHNALNRLEAAGVLRPLEERRWGRTWEAAELLRLVGEFELRVSSPAEPP